MQSTSVLESTVSFAGHKWPKLTPQAFIDLNKRLYEDRKRAMIDVLQEAGADTEVRLKQLTDLETRYQVGGFCLLAIMSPEGICEVFEASAELMKSGEPDIRNMVEVNPRNPDATDAAKGILQMHILLESAEEDDDLARPTKPELGTGDETL